MNNPTTVPPTAMQIIIIIIPAEDQLIWAELVELDDVVDVEEVVDVVGAVEVVGT